LKNNIFKKKKKKKNRKKEEETQVFPTLIKKEENWFIMKILLPADRLTVKVNLSASLTSAEFTGEVSFLLFSFSPFI